MPRLPRREFDVRLSSHRIRLGLTHVQVAEHLSKLARETGNGNVGIDSQSVSKHERGITYPRPLYRRLYTRLYGVAEHELWAECVDTGSEIDRPARILHPTQPGVGYSASLPEGTLLVMAADRARRFLMSAQEGTTPEVIDQLREELQRLAFEYPQRPLFFLLDDLVEMQDTLFTLIDRRQNPKTGRELYFLAGVTSGLLGKASHDLGNPQAAMLQIRTALLAAQQAGHAGLVTWLRSQQSLITFWAGRYAESVAFATRGLSDSESTGGTAAIWLHASAARAHAAMGNVTQAESAVRAAEDSWSSVEFNDLDHFGGECSFNRARSIYYAAEAYNIGPSSGSPHAERRAQDAVQAFQDHDNPEWAFGSEAGARTCLALARIRARDLEGARDALDPVLDFPVGQRINGVVNSVQRVHRAILSAELAADASTLVQELELFSSSPLRMIQA